MCRLPSHYLPHRGAAGVVRFYGPVASRCPGSRRPPTTTEALISSSSSRGLQRDDPGRQPTTTEALLSSPSSRGLQRDDPGGQPSQPPLEALLPLPPRYEVRIIKRIPRASRAQAGTKLASKAVTRANDHASWDRLLRFCSRCFKVPPRGGHRRSLVAAIAKQLGEEADGPSTPHVTSRGRRARKPPQDPTELWASRVSMKLEEGDFRGAVRLPL